MIPLVIVESHQHVLEHIHYILRKKNRQLLLTQDSTWTMLHYDAHPDMACSDTLSAKLCFLPRGYNNNTNNNNNSNNNNNNDNNNDGNTLYDALDATSTGIAEWIMPLVLAAKLSHLIWIKPTFSHQFETGQTTFRIGVVQPSSSEKTEREQQTGETGKQKKKKIESFVDLDDTAVVRVDWHHPYYLDDNHVVMTTKAKTTTTNNNDNDNDENDDDDDLQLSQHLHFQVKHVGDNCILYNNNNNNSNNNDCDNMSNSGSSSSGNPTTSTIPWMLDICLDYFVCRNPYVYDLELVDQEYTKAIVALCKEGMEVARSSSNHDYSTTRRDFFHAMEVLLMHPQQGDDNHHHHHHNHDNKDNDVDDTDDTDGAQELCHVLGRQVNVKYILQSLRIHKQLAKMTIEALPHLVSMPHNSNLPSVQDDLQYQMDDLIQDIARLPTHPFMITMARSANDGFCPLELVEDIQQMVLKKLQQHFKTNDNHDECLVVKDYNEWEGSTLDILYNRR